MPAISLPGSADENRAQEDHPRSTRAAPQPLVGAFDLLASLWRDAESLISHDLFARSEGLDRLASQDAVRRYPLVAYLFATRLGDPDIALRTRIVHILGNILNSDSPAVDGDSPPAGDSAPIQADQDQVVRSLVSVLGEMRTRQIYALLQVIDFDRTSEPLVSSLLSHCSFAGEHLAEILADRSAPLTIRKQAAYFIGSIGFLDALPALNRVAARLEVRCKGRNGGSGFEDLEPVDEEDEASLLPVIQSSLRLLTAP